MSTSSDGVDAEPGVGAYDEAVERAVDVLAAVDNYMPEWEHTLGERCYEKTCDRGMCDRRIWASALNRAGLLVSPPTPEATPAPAPWLPEAFDVESDGSVWAVHTDGSRSMARTNPDNTARPTVARYVREVPRG